MTDYSNHRIVKTKIDGTGWTTYGSNGTGAGQFKSPSGVFYDSSSEYLYIADGNNHRLVKTKIDGTGWTTYGSSGSGTGQFNYPRGIFYDSSSDYIYVADSSNARLVKTKIDGTGWTIYGSSGSGTGQFFYPTDISYNSSTEDIYVVDYGNNRLVKTKIDGTGWVVNNNNIITIFETSSDNDQAKLDFDYMQNQLLFYPNKTDSAQVVKSSFLNWNASEWHKLKVQYNQSTGTVNLYIDDVLNTSHTFSSTWTLPSYGTYLYIGSDSSGTYTASWKGLIDELMITKDYDLYNTGGRAVSAKITPPADKVERYLTVTIDETLPANTNITYDLLDGNTGSAITGYTNLRPSSSIDMSGISYASYPSLYLRANFSTTNQSSSPTLNSWILSWLPDTTAPTTPTLVSPTDGNSTFSTHPTFIWNASTDTGSGMSKYQLYIDTQLDTDNISANTTTTTSTNSLSCGSHSWYIKAFDKAGNSSSSNSSTLTILCTSISQPPIISQPPTTISQPPATATSQPPIIQPQLPTINLQELKNRIIELQKKIIELLMKLIKLKILQLKGHIIKS